jgi:hypothetical protein
MRNLIYTTIFLFTIVSCKHNDENRNIVGTGNKWSSERIRKYFIDSIALRNGNGKFGNGDSLNDFDKFSKTFFSDIKAKNINDPLIYAFNESYIDTTRIDKNQEWLRITVDPCFDIPYCIIVEKVNNRTKLTIKMTNGYGCYYSGYLNFFNSQFLTDTAFSNISQKLNDLNFWKLGNDTTCGRVLDGENWTFEAIAKGRNNLVKRHSPTVCTSIETKTLLSIANDLKKLSRLTDFLSLKMQTMKKKIGYDW